MTTLTWDRHRGHAASYDVLDVGFNYRIDELRAALGSVQLSRLDGLNLRRAELTARYRAALRDSPLAVPSFGERGHSAHHLLPVVARNEDERDRIRSALTAERIQTSIHYPAIHRFRAYLQDAVRLPMAEAIADRMLTVPLHPNLSESDVDEVCAVLLREAGA
jgi:dTDP-4-amino-4,6-dideoxygalactose transaminase